MTSPSTSGAGVPLFRQVLGDHLRHCRKEQGRTLRQVAHEAQISFGYISEVERGTKEASSELLSAICGALGIPLSQVLLAVSTEIALHEGFTRNVVSMPSPASPDSAAA